MAAEEEARPTPREGGIKALPAGVSPAAPPATTSARPPMCQTKGAPGVAKPTQEHGVAARLPKAEGAAVEAGAGPRRRSAAQAWG
jgi:hypothetical protein